MKKNHLTIIFMKDTNKPLTFELSIKLIVFLVVLVISCVSTYAFFIQGYYSLYRDNEKLEIIVRSLKTDIARLQNNINRLSSQDSSSLFQEHETELLSGLEKDSAAAEAAVNVEALKIETNSQARAINYTFILEKVVDDQYTVNGYVFVVLRNHRNQKKIASFPDVEFKNGEPVDFRRGDRFNIRRFKQYKGEFSLDKQADILEVLIYSDMGQLLVHLRRSASTV